MPKLEEEINQKKFSNDYQKLAVNVLYTHGWLINKFAKLLKHEQLTLSQYNVLRILRGQHPEALTVNVLKERMLDKTPDVSRLVDRIIEKKLIERSACNQDRRRVNIVITSKGLELLKKLDHIDDEFKIIFQNLNKNEVVEMNNYLDKLRG